jgi:diacylglycerol kinase
MRRRNRGNLVTSIRHALEGIACVIREERNARIHLAATAAVIVLGLWLGLTPIEWALIVVAIALVFVGEMLNTVVEVVVDLVTPEEHPLAKCAKDIAAGAILVASLAAAIIGLLVLGPPLWRQLSAAWTTELERWGQRLGALDAFYRLAWRGC